MNKKEGFLFGRIPLLSLTKFVLKKGIRDRFYVNGILQKPGSVNALFFTANCRLFGTILAF